MMGKPQVTKKVKCVEFGILSPDIARKMSQIRVVTPDTYDEDGYPIEGGLMDLHLGVIDPGLRCKACGGRMATCPGHFGHIELVRPVIHVGYVKMIYTLLKTTCRSCGRLLLTPEKLEQYRTLLMEAESTEEEEDQSLEIIEKSKKASECPHCKAKQSQIKLIKPTTFYEKEQRLLPSDIRRRMELIADDDLKLMGVDADNARPEWCILTALPVPPVTTRPSITLETGERSEDDLTHKLVDILRINQRLRDNISAGAPQLIIEDLWDLLQYHVTTYFNNEVSGIPPARHRSGRPLKTLAQRLKGKEGRFRYNLSGKRVNFSARTVISPDPNLSINEVGVPYEIAEELTVPEAVTEWNLDYLKKFAETDKYPKANYVIKPDGRRKKVTEINRADVLEELAPGYTVERQLMDGDIVLFNRQPSLHRISMMCHRVKVLPGKTFRLHPAVCKPYNADFDGDEMNLHVPQTEEARAEALSLMLVQDQVISPRFGAPIIKGDEDIITGGYLMTQRNVKFSKNDAERILMKAGITDIPEPDLPDNQYSGKLLFSQCLPKRLSIEYKAEVCRKCPECKKEKCEYDAYVKIKSGRIITGVMDKVGFQGTLLNDITRKFGTDESRRFIDQSTALVLAALMDRGFTVSLADMEIPKDAQTEIAAVLKDAKEQTNAFIRKYHAGELKRIPGKTLEGTLEDNIMAILGKARYNAGNIAAKYLGIDNSSMIMSRVGARGSLLNVTQMSAVVGQQAVRGGRILRGYKSKTLPHFKEGEIGMEARGFVNSSFYDGLTPIEYFFHAMGGREGLVDKGIRTAKSGYMQRKLINALQDLVLRSDGTVRDASDTVVQFTYGEDGADPMKCHGDDSVKLREESYIEERREEEGSEGEEEVEYETGEEDMGFD
ncbi:MAG: DNA-directed RNA polymerase subunit A' [Candidatus Diapherotrites archaeon]|nr:DNA-directed RNA polymerase subunit A' [Candidatus Diapherotrites archaeon]